MNSTLPNFLAAPGAAPAGAPQLNAAAFAGLLSAPAGSSPGENPAVPPADFSTLMPAPSATLVAAPLITVSPLLPAQPTVVNPAAPAPTTQAVVVSQTAPVVVTAPAPNRRFTTTTASANSVKPLATEPAPNAATIQIPSWSRSDLAAESAPTGAATPRLPLTDLATTPAEVPEEIREQAVAFVATLIQSLLPETQVPVPPAGSAPSTDSLSPDFAPAAPLPRTPLATETTAAVRAPAAQVVTTPVNAPATTLSFSAPTPTSSAPALPAREAASTLRPADAKSSSVPVAAQSERSPAQPAAAAPRFVVADDGALEFKLTLPPTAAAEANSGQPKFIDAPVEFRAELDVTGQPLVRVESAGFAAESAATESAALKSAVTESAAASVALPAPQENFAAKNRVKKSAADSLTSDSERKFEFAEDKQVALRSTEAGIAVAEKETIMTAAPTEELRAAGRTPEPMVSPARVEFQVAQAPAERITAPVPGPSGPTFAERAVDTVTGLIDAQFSASMQKSGSVQLHLKFGGEDLSVRVEIRDGAVHTDFRTDSAPLRAALEREWQAVVSAAPAQMQRYLEPVFSPGSGASTNSYSAHGDARQQQHAEPDAQQRQARESFSDHPAFTRRSLLSESFIPEPPIPRVAAFLPTSLRLSALA